MHRLYTQCTRIYNDSALAFPQFTNVIDQILSRSVYHVRYNPPIFEKRWTRLEMSKHWCWFLFRIDFKWLVNYCDMIVMLLQIHSLFLPFPFARSRFFTPRIYLSFHLCRTVCSRELMGVARGGLVHSQANAESAHFSQDDYGVSRESLGICTKI